MEQVIAQPRSENPARLIHGSEVQRLIADRQEFCPKIEACSFLRAVWRWRCSFPSNAAAVGSQVQRQR
jgi:hypothetical protein